MRSMLGILCLLSLRAASMFLSTCMGSQTVKILVVVEKGLNL